MNGPHFLYSLCVCLFCCCCYCFLALFGSLLTRLSKHTLYENYAVAISLPQCESRKNKLSDSACQQQTVLYTHQAKIIHLANWVVNIWKLSSLIQLPRTRGHINMLKYKIYINFSIYGWYPCPSVGNSEKEKKPIKINNTHTKCLGIWMKQVEKEQRNVFFVEQFQFGKYLNQQT